MADNFAILPDTLSPRKRYALAWRVRGRTDINWKQIEAGGDAADEILDNVLKNDTPNYNEPIENYVVDPKARAIVTRIAPLYHTIQMPGEKPVRYKAGGGYWQTRTAHPNHDSLAVQWLADESLVVLLYSGKWQFEAIYLMERQGSAFRQAEIGQVTETFVREYLRRNWAREYRMANNGKALVISAQIQRLSVDTITLNITAEVPKQEDPTFEGILKLGIVRTGRALTVQPLSLQKS